MKKILSFLIIIISLFMFISVQALDDDPIGEPTTDDQIVEPTTNDEEEPTNTDETNEEQTQNNEDVTVQEDTKEPEPEPVYQPPKKVVKVEEPEEEVETTGEESGSLLLDIESKIVKISLKEDVYEYNISIDSDVKELDLKPITKDENTSIEISSQVISELKDNKITILVKNGTKEETYTIKVRVRPEIKEEVNIEKLNYREKYIAFIFIFGIIIVVCVIFMIRKK